MRKYFAAFVGCSLLAIVITIVCLISFEPVDSLMKPPMSNGENHEIQLAFEDYTGKNYKLRAPLSGEYRSSYIFNDFNGDLQNEVIVFYTTEDEVDALKMCLLVKRNNIWKAVSVCESTYSEVQRVEFADFDNDGISEILVGWTAYQNDLSRSLNIYSVPLEGGSFKNLYSCSYTDFEVIDIDSDDKSDVAVFEGAQSGMGIVFSFKSFESGNFVTKGEINLDSSVYSVFNLAYDFSERDNLTRLYVDGYKIDGGLITECIYWDSQAEALKKITSAKKVSLLSSRMTSVSCQDVDSDGFIEIPLEITLDNSKVISKNSSEVREQSIIKWIRFDGAGYETVTYQLIYNNNDFRITFDESWVENITVTNDYNKKAIYFYLNDKKNEKILFELRYTTTQIEEDALSNKYKLLTETGKGKLFYIVYNSDSELNINRSYIQKSIVF